VNRYVELRLGALDALWPWPFDEGAHQTLRCREDQGSRNGVDRGQREDWSVIIPDGRLVLTMVLDKPMRGDVTMYHQLGMAMRVTLVHVLGRGDRQQADSQAEHACDNPGHPHT
jgi:hypothetical protein